MKKKAENETAEFQILALFLSWYFLKFAFLQF